MSNTSNALLTAADALEAQAAALRQRAAELDGAPDDAPLCVAQAAFLASISTRQMYRLAPKVGYRVGGAWRICPARLAKLTANFGERRRRRFTANQGD